MAYGFQTEVIVQALGLAQGTVSKVLKRNREMVVPTLKARPGRPCKTTEREDRYLVLCAEMGVPSQQTPSVLSGDGSLIPLYPEC